MRIAIARAVSIVGHPVILLLAAAMIAASTRGASLAQLQFIAGAMLTLAVVVLGFSWLQVRAGRWTRRHVIADVVAGLVLGAAGGGVYQIWIASL